MTFQVAMAYSFSALTRAFSDQFEAPTSHRRSALTTTSTSTTHAGKERRNVDMVVHLTGGRVLRPVLVHPHKSRTRTADQASSSRGSGQSQSVERQLAGGCDGEHGHLRSPVNAVDTDASTSARLWSSRSANTSLIAAAASQVGGRPALDALRADSDPQTRAELNRHSTRVDGSNALPSVAFVDEMMRASRNADDHAAVVAADAEAERVAPSRDDVALQRRIRYRRSSRAQRRLDSSATSEFVLPIVSSNFTYDDEPMTTALDTSKATAVRRRRTRLRINVSGQYFEIGRKALAQHPKTLLGDGARRTRYYDAERDEFFFDRHRPSFEAIFAYYQTGGRLRRPFNVPDDIFLDELLFYELEPDAVDEYKRSEGYAFEELPMPSNELQRRIWTLFEYPETSRSAFFIAVLSVVMTLVSIVLFCIETLPIFATSHCVSDEAPNFLDPFFIIETICTAWFTVEAIVRFAACPSKIAFWKDFKNIVDVTAVLPYYVTLFNVLSTMSCEGAKSSASLSFLRVIRLVRVFKLTKHSVGLQVLVLTFKASLEGLGLFLVALFVSLLVFSSAIYYAELGQPNSQMNSIPDAFWWAIITMTTVGYGDKVPVGPTGRLIGAACAITGVLTLAIPVPIITGHFNRFYSHKTGRGRHA